MKNELKWFWDFSPSKRRAFIVDAEGFTICPPVLSRSVAAVIVGKHNHAIAADMPGEVQAHIDADPYGIHEERRRHP